MDFSKLNGNEKLAVYGSVAAIIGPVLASAGFGFGAGGLTLILALAMLAIVFLPQLSPQTTLPGSKGSLMVIVGGVAAVSAALSLLASIGYLGFFGSNVVNVLGWLVGIGGGLLMGWAGWQEFQSEGGQLKLGTTSGPAASAPPPSAPAEPMSSTTAAPSSPPPAPAPPAQSAPAGDSAPDSGTDAMDEHRPSG